MSGGEESAPFKWIGGDLSLDFNNTVDWLGLEPQAGERLTDHGRLVAWAREGGVVSEEIGRSLLTISSDRPAAAEEALRRALQTRSLIHRIFLAVIIDPGAVPTDLDELNTLLVESPAYIEHDASDKSFAWTWASEHNGLTDLLQPVVWSASQLLTSPDVARVKTCTNDDCGWLFLDTSRKHNRKWCEMAVCGNRAKARRFYRRAKDRTRS
jgi:predicted RNA-binding Zn ribbon-like protein